MKYFYKRVGIFLCLINTSLAAVAQQSKGPLGLDMMWNGLHGPFFAPILIIIYIVFVILGVAFLVQWLQTGSRSQEEQELFDILEEKYTNGSIDEDEFIARQQLLREK